MRRFVLDVTPLRNSSGFRRIFASGLITYLGSMITTVALPFQVAESTDSFVAVGAVALVQLPALAVFGMLGGSLADIVDRTRMVLWTEIGSFLIAAGLLVNALLPSPLLGMIYLLAFASAVMDGLQRPSLDAIIPRVVGHQHLAAAGTLMTLRWNLGAIVGPAIGGLLLAAGGPGLAYGVDAVSFAASAVILVGLARHPIRGQRGSERSTGLVKHQLQLIKEGATYALKRRDLLGTYLVDLIAMIMAYPFALFPFLAKDLDATWALGLLYSAGAVGGLLVALTSGWVSHIHHHGRAIVIAAACWGSAVGLIAFAPGLWWILLLLAIAGGADVISGIFRGLIWNQTIPDEIRGRLAGIELLSYTMGPQLGQFRSSVVAASTTLRTSLASGGLFCVLGVALTAWCLPAMWRYDVRTSPDARRQREVSDRDHAE
ncbi:MAG: MFS transporter [Actinomycetales bacterium]|nr:MFS transporter [Actinomycetales bacterium]